MDDFSFGSCNCGGKVRYFIKDKDGTPQNSCNKYKVCPTYQELEEENVKITTELAKARAIISKLKDIMGRVNNF